MAQSQADPPGFLVRGPYIQIPAGAYHVQLKYRSTQPIQTPIGRLEVFSEELRDNPNQGILGQIQLTGSAGQNSMISGAFILPQDLHSGSLELRVYWNGTGDLTVDQIIIYQLDN
jgi:hypothetical protein